LIRVKFCKSSVIKQEMESPSASDSESKIDSDSILRIDMECVQSPRIMDQIYSDMSRDYYMSTDWSVDFYMVQAIRGLIAVGHEVGSDLEILLPQMQRSYCLFDWENISRNKCILKQIRNRFNNFRIRINHDPKAAVCNIHEFHGRKSWLSAKYREILEKLFVRGTFVIEGIPTTSRSIVFRMCSIEMYSPSDELVAAELGYVIGGTFTSLTGFCLRQKGVSIGKVQILALAKLLSVCGFQFLNMGQPPERGCMQYKTELGGVEFLREAFLRRWNSAIDATPNGFGEFIRIDITLEDLFG
jgi:Leu/Phe-tRNA-protein transferase